MASNLKTSIIKIKFLTIFYLSGVQGLGLKIDDNWIEFCDL